MTNISIHLYATHWNLWNLHCTQMPPQNMTLVQKIETDSGSSGLSGNLEQFQVWCQITQGIFYTVICVRWQAHMHLKALYWKYISNSSNKPEHGRLHTIFFKTFLKNPIHMKTCRVFIYLFDWWFALFKNLSLNQQCLTLWWEETGEETVECPVETNNHPQVAVTPSQVRHVMKALGLHVHVFGTYVA